MVVFSSQLMPKLIIIVAATTITIVAVITTNTAIIVIATNVITASFIDVTSIPFIIAWL